MNHIPAYLKFILTLLVAVIAVGGYLTIQSLDRLRAVNMQLLEEIRELKLQPRLAVPAAASPAEGGKQAAVPADTANLEYFDAKAPVGGELRQAVAAEPPNLNVLICNEYTASVLNSLCTSPLAERDWAQPEGEFKPMLAQSWEVSPDHLEYRVKLRPGVLWHDFTDPVSGREFRKVPVTAHDFKFFVDTVKNPAVNCAPLRVYYQDLDTLEVINDLEFTVRWKKPFYGSMAYTLGMSPLPRHFFCREDGSFDADAFNNGHRRNRMIVGCGPYRFVEWQKNRRLVFKRNENYFGIPLGIAPPLEKLIFEVIPLANTRFQALSGGKLDKLGLTPEQWINKTGGELFRNGSIRKYKYPVPGYTYIGYNQRNPLFADKRVRQALTMLVDRERIRREVMHSLAVIATGPFFPLSSYSDKSIKPWPFDPAAAGKLLAEAGWRDSNGDGVLDKNGMNFSFTMLQVANHPTQEKMFPLIRESFAAAGIEMKIQIVEWSVYISRLENRSFDACSLGWATGFDPDLYQVWHSDSIPAPGSNHISYSNPELDRLILKMRRTFDRQERIDTAHRIGRILHEEQPYTFLFNSFNLNAVSGKLQNVRVLPSGIPDLIMWKKQ